MCSPFVDISDPRVRKAVADMEQARRDALIKDMAERPRLHFAAAVLVALFGFVGVLCGIAAIVAFALRGA